MPNKISVILPLFNGISYISESIESILAQTFSDWELIVVSEYGNIDGSAEVVQEYSNSDNRIKLISNKERLGLAESLNIGIKHAQGEYIARADVDDPSYPERFAVQVEFLDSNPEIFMCGTLTRSVVPGNSYVLNVPCEREELKAAMLFGCEISHCSVMFRRNDFITNGYRYDSEKLGEDYDLWTKIMFQSSIVNVPQVLVDHRWGFGSISIEKGEKLKQEVREISASCLKKLDINVSDKDLVLLSSWRNVPTDYAKRNIPDFIRRSYKLLTKIEEKNSSYKLFDEKSLSKILWKRWNWTCSACSLKFNEYDYDRILNKECNVSISVVLPVYNAVLTLRETIDSIIDQSFSNWELVIICEYGNFDGSTEIAKYYEKLDKRIKVIVNSERLGLAESLNVGIRNSKGKYIARIDADDISLPNRLGEEYNYMEQHLNIGVVQTYQQYFGEENNQFVHCPAIASEDIKAKLLFFCDVCHSTVMLRKSVVEQNELFYNPQSQIEDFDLWTRLVNISDIATIPEVYGKYRQSEDNISIYKTEQIQNEMCHIVGKQLYENLNIIIPEEQVYLLGGWINVFEKMDTQKKQRELQTLRNILTLIWNANQKCRYYQAKSLLYSIAAKWYWSVEGEPWQGHKKVRTFTEIFKERDSSRLSNHLFRFFIKTPLTFLQSVSWHLNAKSRNHLNSEIVKISDIQNQQLNQYIERWTWERYKRIEKDLKILQGENAEMRNLITQMQHQRNCIPYSQGEKVRIVFLFQIASFWPSWESLYESCIIDSRIDAKLVFLDETNTEQSQMLTAKQFLENNHINYEKFDDLMLEEFKPHIIVIQTPYDEWHRKEEHWSNRFSGQGYRLVYIPYGIEISDTEDSHKLHFNTNVINNCWRIYTFSDIMKRDYKKYCANSNAVKALGLPRFDYYFNSPKKNLPYEIEAKRKKRPVVIWKLHFPKVIEENGKKVFVSPDLNEYVKFASILESFQNFFFILVPHPKFVEQGIKLSFQNLVYEILGYTSEAENAWIDDGEDYRNSLKCADYVIVDRSAVMVEAGALNIPVLYMSNDKFYEPPTNAIKPLLESYYQGTRCDDMVNFLKMCQNGKDYKASLRRSSFNNCIPYFDGKSGERVKEDMLNGIVQNL